MENNFKKMDINLALFVWVLGGFGFCFGFFLFGVFFTKFCTCNGVFLFFVFFLPVLGHLTEDMQ